MTTVLVALAATPTRADVRVISTALRDLPGVATVEIDLGDKTVRVTGSATAEEVRTTIAAKGYELAT